MPALLGTSGTLSNLVTRKFLDTDVQNEVLKLLVSSDSDAESRLNKFSCLVSYLCHQS